MHNPMITFSVPSEKEGTSDSFVVFLSEVPLCCCQPDACRRKSKEQKAGANAD